MKSVDREPHVSRNESVGKPAVRTNVGFYRAYVIVYHNDNARYTNARIIYLAVFPTTRERQKTLTDSSRLRDLIRIFVRVWHYCCDDVVPN